MSPSQAVLGWMEEKSDWLSPIVVKEVRQIVRGQEFAYSFSACLVAGLTVAFFGAADSVTGNATSGTWTFVALIACLALLGLAVVPLGAFSALRNERMEQTLELITLTALSPRRVVVGKLLAHSVKLVTLFSAVAPFIAMSFLLGGVDFVSILLALAGLFLWSMWAIAACLFLSCLFKNRAMSGLVFGGAGLLLFVVFGMGRVLFFSAGFGATSGGFGGGIGGSPQYWRGLAMVATGCLVTMLNLVLLAENRLLPATGNRVTPLRLGFLLQFLLIVTWTLTFIDAPAASRSSAASALAVLGGWHLAVVAAFTVTESLEPQRVRSPGASGAARVWRDALFGPGGSRGAVYVLAQMVVLLAAGWQLGPTGFNVRWFMAICAYICFFTGVPTVVIRSIRPRAPALHARVAILMLLFLSMVLPDIVYYLLWRPAVFNLNYSARHLLNPLRTLSNWQAVHVNGWVAVTLAVGVAGLIAYAMLLVMAARMAAREATQPSASAAGAGGGRDAPSGD